MEPTQSLDRAPVGRHGDPCASCGTPLAQDQRYCLACGARRPGLPAMPPGAPAPPPAVAAGEPAPEPAWRRRPDTALAAGVACLLLALLIGVLIGRSGRDRAPAAAAPQVLTVGAAPTATPGSGAAAPAAFTSDWPDGKKGFTVQLQVLPKAGAGAAAVAAARQAATGAGAAAVGALDSDTFSSLDPGNYVVYSGQFPDEKAAQAALAGLKAKFPAAKVVEVSSSSGAAASKGTKTPATAEQKKSAKAIQDLQSASPQEYQKKSAKLPKQVTTPGKLPPKDNKPAGGGGKSQSFE